MTQIYEARGTEGKLRADPAQHAILLQLEDLRLWLEEHAAKKRGLLGGLFSKAAISPKGLYLWGGVGRGKSMLMDLFFDAVDIEAKRRVHFHAFMQDIHRGMHAARKKGAEDALAPVAEADYKVMPHSHPEERIYTVLSGTWYIGLGDNHQFDNPRPERQQCFI